MPSFTCRKPGCGRSFRSLSKLRTHGWAAHPEAYKNSGNRKAAAGRAPKPALPPIPTEAAPIRRKAVSRPAAAPMLMDDMTLRMALVGYEAEKERIDGRIEEIRRQLGHAKSGRPKGTGAATSGIPQAKKPHRISPEGIKRIQDAQKRRWAASKPPEVATPVA